MLVAKSLQMKEMDAMRRYIKAHLLLCFNANLSITYSSLRLFSTDKYTHTYTVKLSAFAQIPPTPTEREREELSYMHIHTCTYIHTFTSKNEALLAPGIWSPINLILQLRLRITFCVLWLTSQSLETCKKGETK